MKAQQETVKNSYKVDEHKGHAYNQYVRMMNNILVDNMDELNTIIESVPSIETETALNEAGIKSDLLDVANARLRRKYNIHVHVMQGSKEGFGIDSNVWDFNPDLNYYYSYCFVDTKIGNSIKDDFNEQYYGMGFRTYEETLEAGLNKVLDLIKTKKIIIS